MILGVESSCDESALALFDGRKGIVESLVHSQLELHREFGGVVPDLAVREHLDRFPVLFRELGRKSSLCEVDRIAVTRGPGLAGCLAIGISAAKACGLLWNCPVVGVNHLTAHAWSPFVSVHRDRPETFAQELGEFLPHLGLIVSGGNTLLFRLNEDRSVTVLADTRDDAAGEALDKGAKLMGLPYPGGPEIERRAEGGNPRAFEFPRAFANPKDRAFSFSGVKTSLRYRLEKMTADDIRERTDDLCASYQAAVVDALTRKFSQVLKAEKGIRSIGLSGGVANNRGLREAFAMIAKRFQTKSLVADPGLTGDNAAMIAFAAFAYTEGLWRGGQGQGMRFEPSLPLGG